jgi:hypothetical protein
VRTPNYATDGPQQPGETPLRTAVVARFMVRMGRRFDSGGGSTPRLTSANADEASFYGLLEPAHSSRDVTEG